jgi:hypothetical protein
MADVSPLIADLEFPARIPVKDQETVLYWVNAEGARRLWKKGLVALRTTNQRVRALEVIHRATPPGGSSSILGLTGSDPLHSPAYSHNHEVSETYLDDDGEIRRRHPLDANPERVWTLRRLPEDTADLYTTVLTDCLVKPKARVVAMQPRPSRLPKAA